MKQVKKEIDFNGKKITLETGKLAPQANVSIKATYGETVILVTAVSGGQNPDLDYFPLQMSYEEKLYASGTIKTSRFVKRDGRPTDDATVTRRLIDRAIRPLFPDDFSDEIQIIMTVLSLDEDSDPAFLAGLAASAALQASNIPFEGPMIPVKVGYADQKYILIPTRKQTEEDSDLNMMVSFSGTDRKFLSIDASANILPEKVILGAIEFARDNAEPLLNLVMDFAKEYNPDGTKYTYISSKPSDEVINSVKAIVKDELATLIKGNYKYNEALNNQKSMLVEKVFTELEGKFKKSEMVKALEKIEKNIARALIMESGKRIDGRSESDLRPISGEVGLLPRTHGSGLFNRGLTQALTVATLGNPSLELLIQDMYGEKTKRYLHYYNFPPFATGEVGRIGGANPREIGHGMLAEKALVPVIPSKEEFPYTILLMTETLSSNGSSSMAATCGSTLALMDAGVPIKGAVGGVAMGLMANEDQSEFMILNDLSGYEDSVGYMDFKMTGTKEGITAIQVDIKLKGLPMDLIPRIIEKSREARLEIIEKIEEIISSPRDSLSKYAPKMCVVKIDPTKIGMVIGSGGKTIKEIQEQTNTELGIDDDGTVFISGESEEDVARAQGMVEGLTKDIEVGEVYEGTVKEIVDFGAFVEILPNKQGLLHISEITDDYVEKASDHLKEGQVVTVKVIETGPNGKVSLSMRAMNPGYEPKPRHSDRGGRSSSGGHSGRDRNSHNSGGGRDRGGRNFRDRR
ncbi:polyribonucleotide nucleotidyltransferase [Candidatus Nomurabacteria bacterium]|uniref:Polyribonucleotide nucleotidyltransferase n=1 Tax=candidate division WWE3 bacterium TaxID=2053526 RepID=A0A955IVL6_UNCKA|nr:polyribonucleotide nucleotidyltransferase [candidate division WWE3 bacterium]MCB9823824.1 polyribonucleotide nucleotidyltransferase [Candidatus Nomurabacteria bacterium]MCB9826770.1 polyribonucleotide nucleotidyltransferase [Candidatus Nomurabacteria bacterium]MCB9827619.1 polyribonucleotide nucleotidyltransferase [Candidatus Nomurabacteria bacterium]HXK52471.1 polyribonucleotide nucleotidyltransferase [bacterium]